MCVVCKKHHSGKLSDMQKYCLVQKRLARISPMTVTRNDRMERKMECGFDHTHVIRIIAATWYSYDWSRGQGRVRNAIATDSRDFQVCNCLVPKHGTTTPYGCYCYAYSLAILLPSASVGYQPRRSHEPSATLAPAARPAACNSRLRSQYQIPD